MVCTLFPHQTKSAIYANDQATPIRDSNFPILSSNLHERTDLQDNSNGKPSMTFDIVRSKGETIHQRRYENESYF